jgi:hypothetical protein
VSATRSSRRQQGVDSAPQVRPIQGATIAVGVFLALLILFLWLHFIVAQENEMIGREIQARTEDLARIERENMALRRQVAAAWAEPEMARRARSLGYQPQQPLYILLSQPLVPAAGGSRTEKLLLPSLYGNVSPAGRSGEASTEAESDSSMVTAAERP